MSDYILITGDKAIFMPNFEAATVVVRPGILKGSGPETINRKKVCVLGDERKVSVTNCQYMTPSYPIPGTGTLEIASLASDQIARHAQTANRSVLLVGGSFDARFVVTSPAKQPPPTSTPDGTLHYLGKGKFITTNRNIRGV
jgi:hypothetical protein